MKDELILVSRPKSGVSEAIKTIRTNLQFSSIDEKIKTLLITSSISGEGKSFVSANLASAFAQSGLKVILVDCDMRCGRQHQIFGVENDKGLSNLLLDTVQLNYNSYIKETKIENLSLLPMGIIPPNPIELLESLKFKTLIDILQKKYDLVILDGVPVINLTDSLVMAGLVDKIIIVSAYKQTPMELLKDTTKTLKNYRDKIAGVIVNKMPAPKNKYNNYYTRYYNE